MKIRGSGILIKKIDVRSLLMRRPKEKKVKQKEAKEELETKEESETKEELETKEESETSSPKEICFSCPQRLVTGDWWFQDQLWCRIITVTKEQFNPGLKPPLAACVLCSVPSIHRFNK